MKNNLSDDDYIRNLLYININLNILRKLLTELYSFRGGKYQIYRRLL